MSVPFMKLEKPLDEYALLCRGCLAESGEMKNIFDWGFTEDFFKCTGIQVNQADSISELLCTQCEDKLQTCKNFREQCHRSDSLLKSAAKRKQLYARSEDNNDSTKESKNNHDNTVSCILYDKKLVIVITAPDMDSKIYLSCPHCPNSFIKQKDLSIHLAKMHHVNPKEFIIELQYYCSVHDCSYHLNSGKSKHFQGRKYLNQHYNKVHLAKTFQCEICSQKFSTTSEYNRHYKDCNVTYLCQVCNKSYKSNEKLLVHLMRNHPDLHKQYKKDRRALKRKSETVTEVRRPKEDRVDFSSICDSPKRSFATQTFVPEESIKNDVTLPSWRSDSYAKRDEISTQTVFEDLMSIKSQTSEDESIFFSETVSLSDIQTQTFPLEFGLSRSNKETITSETQSPDLSIKETQTCYCLYDSPKINFKMFDSVSSSPCSINLTSTETQTGEMKCNVKSDVLLSFNSAETQTSFDDGREIL